MPFIPHTAADVQHMLHTIGADSIDALFDEIPESLRIQGLEGIPPGLSEMEIGRLMSERARRDGQPLSFLGGGAYEHHIPAAVWAIATRGEFYSAYTPYQAEASQGTLQLIHEYQTMMSSLTGLEVSNASLYDGGSAVAEAALMAVRAHRKSKSLRLLVPATLNPNYRRVALSTAGNQGLQFECCQKSFRAVHEFLECHKSKIRRTLPRNRCANLCRLQVESQRQDQRFELQMEVVQLVQQIVRAAKLGRLNHDQQELAQLNLPILCLLVRVPRKTVGAPAPKSSQHSSQLRLLQAQTAGGHE